MSCKLILLLSLLHLSQLTSFYNFNGIPNMPDYHTPSGLADLIQTYNRQMFRSPKSVFFQYAWVATPSVQQEVLRRLDELHDMFGVHGMFIILDEAYFTPSDLNGLSMHDWTIRAIREISSRSFFREEDCFIVTVTYPVRTRTLTLTITVGSNFRDRWRASVRESLINKYKKLFVKSVNDNILDFMKDVRRNFQHNQSRGTYNSNNNDNIADIINAIDIGKIAETKGGIVFLIFGAIALFIFVNLTKKNEGDAQTVERGGFSSTTGSEKNKEE